MDLKRAYSAGVRSGWIPDSPLYWGILIMTIKVGLAATDLFTVSELLDNAMIAVGMLIFLYYALRGWPSFKGMLLCWIGLGVIGVAALRIRNFHLLITAMTVLALRNGDIKKALRLIFYWNCLFFAMNILLSIPFHFAGLRTIMSDDTRKYWMVIPRLSRLRFGYTSSSSPGGVLFQLASIWCYLNFGNIRKRDAAVILLLNLALYFFCANKTSLMLSAGMLVLVFSYQERQNRKNPLLDLGAAWLAPFLSVFFIGIMLLYPNWTPFIWKVNKLFTNRIAASTAWYLYWGLTLFGRSRAGVPAPSFPEIGTNTSALDCLYETMGVWMGILPLVIILICFYLLARRKNTADNVMVLIWSIYSITECDGLNCYLFFPLILTAAALPNLQGEGKTEWCPLCRKARKDPGGRTPA